MDKIQPILALFDLDGVVVDTESQYSFFWHKIGVDYLGMEDLEVRIKGETLSHIYDTFFKEKKEKLAEITAQIAPYEQQMTYNYFPGFLDFITDLRRHGCHTAVVTSSDRSKMEIVCRVHPEMEELFDCILTAEMFTASKPAPDCYLMGMKNFGANPETTYIFEDSFNGLRAAEASGAHVIGLATTNPSEAVAPFCHHVLSDFRGFTFEQMMRVHK